jgi:quercetin dioxygenase-like cupin family protein
MSEKFESDTLFSHVKHNQGEFKGGGLRDFFLYKDLGVAEATKGRILAHVTKANLPPEAAGGTGWHYHVADFQIVYMLKGWAKFMYEDKIHLVEAGDCVQQRPGIVHYLYDYSPDMEYLEIITPVDYGTVSCEGPCDIPDPEPWPEK